MEFPNLKGRKSDRFALSSTAMDAEARRIGVEILANKGLLHEVFKYFDAADHVRLAASCKFFNKVVSEMYLKKVEVLLRLFVSDLRTFISLIHSLDIKMTGAALLALFGETSKSSTKESDLALSMPDGTGAKAMIKHLTTLEGYKVDKVAYSRISNSTSQAYRPPFSFMDAHGWARNVTSFRFNAIWNE